MLHIGLIILKIAGILLLVILGLVLLGLLAVLFVPIRYQGDGSYHAPNEGKAKLRVHWLFHVISLRIVYERELFYELRLFGRKILGSEDEEETTFPENSLDSERNIPEETAGAGESTIRTAEWIDRAEHTSQQTDVVIEQAEETARRLEEAVRQRSLQIESEEEKNGYETSDVQPENPAASVGRKRSLGDRLKQFARWMKEKAVALRDSFRAFIVRLRKTEHWRQSVVAFLEDEENQKSFFLIKRQWKRFLHHILPGKLSGQVRFGLEDPYWMGQILSAAAFLYPIYGKQIELEPVMDEEILDGKISFRGRVQIGILALIVLRVWMDKNIRTQIHKYRNRGGR